MAKIDIKKILLLFIIFSVSALLIASATFYIKKKRGRVDMKAASQPAPMANDTVEKMTGVKYNGVKDGKLVWELTSVIALKDKQTGVVNLETVNFVYHSEEGLNYYIVGRTGAYDEPNKILKVNAVTAHTEDGYSFTAAKASYSFSGRRIEADGSVKLMLGSMQSVGENLVYDMDNQAIKLSGNVRTTFDAKEVKKK